VARERREEDAAARTEAVLEDIERSWASSRTATRIAVGIHDLGLHQEVQDFLGRDPKLELVGAAADAHGLVAMLGERSPDVALVCPTVGRELRHPAVRSSGCPVVVVAEEVTVPILREAIEAGAQAVFGWPDERAQLARSLAAFRTLPRGGATTRAMVVAVLGARGGAGATFVATHLAAAFAGTGLRTALVDLDVSFADVSAALGIGGSSEVAVRTIQDLLPVKAGGPPGCPSVGARAKAATLSPWRRNSRRCGRWPRRSPPGDHCAMSAAGSAWSTRAPAHAQVRSRARFSTAGSVRSGPS
jgi:hypothetical protein